MSKTFEQIYKKILDVAPNINDMKSGDAVKLKADGFMDLNIDVLYKTEEGTRIAMSHYYKHPSGDMIADPDMEIMLYPDKKQAEALTYQDGYRYDMVYDDGEANKPIQNSLNNFLNTWLNNIKMQGHQIGGQENDKGREI
jgi:uncharacterized protein YqiB (DUF1249 family)